MSKALTYPALKKRSILALLSLLLCFCFGVSASGQDPIDITTSPEDPKLNRSRGLNMLEQIKEVVEGKYYDKTFRGIDLDQRFKTAAERIKTLNTNAQIFRVIAQVLLDFNDSHTKFFPPPRALKVEYGLSMQMIGDECTVVDVRNDSDAATKGVKAGDVVVKINSYSPTRTNLNTIMYLLYQLQPHEKLNFMLRSADGQEREVIVNAKFKSLEQMAKERQKRKSESKLTPFKCREVNAEAIACKLHTFSVKTNEIDRMMKEVKPYKKLILDLRGNGGGYVKTEMYLTGYFFDRPVKIGDEVQRANVKERIAKSLKDKVFPGDLIVLIDSHSASAAEVFARVVQIEKRGKVVGDVSAGAVMTSRFHSLANTRGAWNFEWSVFGVNVTVGDLIMSDGNRIEGVGVIPDKAIGPSAEALLQKDDPVLAYAASVFGTNLSAAQARQFHFITHRYENSDDKDDEDEGEGEDK